MFLFFREHSGAFLGLKKKKFPNSAAVNDSLCRENKFDMSHIIQNTLEVLKGSKGTREVERQGRGSQVLEARIEKFSKHLKEKQPILNMLKIDGFKFQNCVL